MAHGVAWSHVTRPGASAFKRPESQRPIRRGGWARHGKSAMAADAAALLLGRAHKLLLDSGSTLIIFSATGFFLLPSSLHPSNMLHLLFFYLTALVGFSLVFLSATIRNFPTAARATAAVADAIARFRFRLLGLQTWVRELLGRSFVTFYCSVWCAGALAYAIANVSLCYHGLAWMCYLLFGVN